VPASPAQGVQDDDTAGASGLFGPERRVGIAIIIYNVPDACERVKKFLDLR
jgi:hypothetical protein